MNHARSSAFTLIETVISLSIMSVLLLGLSGAVMIGSRAIPTGTQIGVADQQVIDALNLFRSDLRMTSSITHTKFASAHIFTLDIKDTGTPGTPARIAYTYDSNGGSFSRSISGRDDEVLISNITALATSIEKDGADASVLWMLLGVEGTIQNYYEIHVALPDKPEAK